MCYGVVNETQESVLEPGVTPGHYTTRDVIIMKGDRGSSEWEEENGVAARAAGGRSL